MPEAPGGSRDEMDRLRALPSVDRVVKAIEGSRSGAIAVGAARRAIDEARAAIRSGAEPPTLDGLVARVETLLEEAGRRGLIRVLNATGVLLHTNLGRAPLGKAQADAVVRAATAYTNLEYDVTSGNRGTRHEHAAQAIAEATGAEDALVVNNNAAAVLLSLAALAGGGEVIISRGELIEIGGEFRIPEVMTISGAALVEVGTTNRTRLDDYRQAIGPATKAILKVHPSNYRVVGFTSSVAARDLASLAHSHDLAFIHDLGSGYLGGAGETTPWAELEPRVDRAVADGADVVTFSGDKLLGGPQAGILAGRRRCIRQLSSHPLLRALRVDKMTLAALAATLRLYLEQREGDLPLWRMATEPLPALERRARALVDAVERSSGSGRNGARLVAIPTASLAGAGSLPDAELPSWGVSIEHGLVGAAEIARRLRALDPPVIARIADEAVVLDLRTVTPEDDDELARLVSEALRDTAEL